MSNGNKLEGVEEIVAALVLSTLRRTIADWRKNPRIQDKNLSPNVYENADTK